MLRVSGSKRPANRVTFPAIGLSLQSIGFDVRSQPNAQASNIAFWNIAEDADDIDTLHREKRRRAAGTRGLKKIATIDLPLRHYAVKRGQDAGVIEHGPDFCGRRDREIDLGGGNIRISLRFIIGLLRGALYLQQVCLPLQRDLLQCQICAFSRPLSPLPRRVLSPFREG